MKGQTTSFQTEHGELCLGSCLDVLAQKSGDSFDLLVTDPPYAIDLAGQGWDKALPSVSIWKECLRVLKPGSFAFVMSSPRQDVLSRAVINLQDAGFRTDFSSIYWSYLDGMGKAVSIKSMSTSPIYKYNLDEEQSMLIDGFSGAYAGYSPKPAVEVVIVAMKPLAEDNHVKQVLANSKGITRLDACRIPFGRRGSRSPANLLVSDGAAGDNSEYFDLDAWFAGKLAGLPKEVQEQFPFLFIEKPPNRERNRGLESNTHPTVKPLRLMSYLIELGSAVGDTVLDPFGGSGTTPVAAKLMGRKFYYIEKEREFFDLALQRVGAFEAINPLLMKGLLRDKEAFKKELDKETRNIFLVPSTAAAMDASIRRAVAPDVLREKLGEDASSAVSDALKGDDARCWAFKGMIGLTLYGKMKNGDIVLFREKGTGLINYMGTVCCKVKSAELARAVWPASETPWELIFFLRDVRQTEINFEEFKRRVGYSDEFRLQGPIVAREDDWTGEGHEYQTLEEFFSSFGVFFLSDAKQISMF